MALTTDEGSGEPTAFNFKLVPTHTPEQLLANVRHALTLGLPEVKQCAAHDEIMSIAGGGPSLQDTYKDLTGFVAAVNGSLPYLLEKGVTPQMCGVCDPSEHMVDIVEAKEGVAYFLASCVHPKVFDKLIAANCTVYLWHLHPIEGLDALLSEYYPDGWVQIPGGCTMGTRWLTLGYHLGFRKFHIHGLDSSFRDKSSHAYPDKQDDKEWITFDGFKTRVNFIGQVVDFIGLMENGLSQDVEPIEIKMFGDGLLQWRYRKWLEAVAKEEKWSGPAAKTKLHVCCVRGGTHFPSCYVNILYDSVMRNLPADCNVDFTVFTDQPDKLDAGIIVRPLPEALPGWWCKMGLFMDGLFPRGDRILYFDLGCVITGPLDELAAYSGPFTTLRDFYRPTGLQNSVMAWEADAENDIWLKYVDAGKPTQFSFNSGEGDHVFIESIRPETKRLQRLFPGMFASYKADRLENNPPAKASVVIFHGKPKPIDVIDGWVPEVWNVLNGPYYVPRHAYGSGV